MAIRGGPKRRGDETTVEEFRKWLMSFDSDKDGKISKKELNAAIRSRGCPRMFRFVNTARGMWHADGDGSGYIEEQEIDDLLDFAEKTLGFKFYR